MMRRRAGPCAAMGGARRAPQPPPTHTFSPLEQMLHEPAGCRPGQACLEGRGAQASHLLNASHNPVRPATYAWTRHLSTRARGCVPLSGGGLRGGVASLCVAPLAARSVPRGGRGPASPRPFHRPSIFQLPAAACRPPRRVVVCPCEARARRACARWAPRHRCGVAAGGASRRGAGCVRKGEGTASNGAPLSLPPRCQAVWRAYIFARARALMSAPHSAGCCGAVA